MEVVFISIVAFLASWLTLISGFGLGTLLLPTFILFFTPIEAVAMTAVVHFLNNVFKFGLLYKKINKQIVLWFGVSGIFGAAIGAWVSGLLVESSAYHAIGSNKSISWFTIVVAFLMIVFALQEIFLGKRGFIFSKKWLIPGGSLSGFFGGLTGHQGALRSMFLLKAGLTTEVYVATGTAIALMVDLTRIPIYLSRIASGGMESHILMLTWVTLSAFAGAYTGKKTIPKVTFSTVQKLVGVLMILIGMFLLLGVL